MDAVEVFAHKSTRFPGWTNLIVGIALFGLVTIPYVRIWKQHSPVYVMLKDSQNSPFVSHERLVVDETYYLRWAIGETHILTLALLSIWSGIGFLRRKRWVALSTSIAGGAFLSQCGYFLAIIALEVGPQLRPWTGNSWNVLLYQGIAFVLIPLSVLLWWIYLLLWFLTPGVSMDSINRGGSQRRSVEKNNWIAVMISMVCNLTIVGVLHHLRPS